MRAILLDDHLREFVSDGEERERERERDEDNNRMMIKRGGDREDEEGRGGARASSLALSLLALADLGFVTSPDGLDSTLRVALVASEEMKPVVLGEGGLEALAG